MEVHNNDLLSPLAVYGCDLSGVECGLFIVPLFIVTTNLSKKNN